VQIRSRILQFLKPIQIWFQRRGYIENEFTTEIIDSLLMRIKPGDILLSYESGRYTSMFIKGEWDHAAIVNENLYVVEAVGDKFVNSKNIGGVRKVKLEEWLWKKNHICVLRYLAESAIESAKKSNDFVGRNYDYSFTKDDKTIYCSELVYHCYLPFNKFFMDHIDADDDILPIDYLNSRHLSLIYNSRK
jgi:uncharacterized protein YycO